MLKNLKLYRAGKKKKTEQSQETTLGIWLLKNVNFLTMIRLLPASGYVYIHMYTIVSLHRTLILLTYSQMSLPIKYNTQKQKAEKA